MTSNNSQSKPAGGKTSELQGAITESHNATVPNKQNLANPRAQRLKVPSHARYAHLS